MSTQFVNTASFAMYEEFTKWRISCFLFFKSFFFFFSLDIFNIPFPSLSQGLIANRPHQLFSVKIHCVSHVLANSYTIKGKNTKQN